MKSLRLLLAGAALGLGAFTVRAQVLTKPTVGLELAKKIAAKAEAEAANRKWTVVIVVVDDGGNLVYLEKMDGTQLGSIEVAQQKARTALQFKRPTKVFEDGVASGRNALLSVTGVSAIEGGIPLIVNGACIGAVGISGMKSSEDGVIAEAAVSVLNEK